MQVWEEAFTLVTIVNPSYKGKDVKKVGEKESKIILIFQDYVII